MSISIKAGNEIVLVGRYAVEITVEPKGIDWCARATARLHGDIVNIVERDYWFGSATAYELREQMLELVGYALDDDYCDALESTNTNETEMPEFKLKNGADLIAKFGDVVLASWDGHTFPYVTWKVDSDGNAYWGRYFADYNLAVANFVRRARG